LGDIKHSAHDEGDEFLESLSDAEDDDRVTSEEFGFDSESEEEDTGENALVSVVEDHDKIIERGLVIWNHYRERLMTDFARVGYLVSPNPVIIAHSGDPDNSDPQNRLAVDRVIERLLISGRDLTEEERNVELARAIDLFWKEREDFVKRRNFFNRPMIWTTAEREDTVAYEWHYRYSRPFTKVFGEIACKTTARILGTGQSERYWKIDKNNCAGNRSNLKSDKTKKQAVISAAYSHQACESRRKDAQRAGVLWSDEDYEYCKLDRYCSGSIIEKLVTKEVRVFHAYLEDWEDVLFNSKGDDIHAARISAKYGGLKFLDEDKDDQVGEFRELDCAILTKCRKGRGKDGGTRTRKKGPGQTHFYSILGVYEGFQPELKLECQVDSVYDCFERFWDVYEMIIDYYKKNPDPNIKIVTRDDGGGKVLAQDNGNESEEDDSDEGE
jgi:hypothetical protein